MEQFMNLTTLLVVLTVITSYQAFNDHILRSKFIFRPASMEERGEWHRFLTHGLIHADWVHLAINMYVLYAFGRFVEMVFAAAFGQIVGSVLYILMYVLGIIASSVPSYFKHKNNYTYSALGASGAVSGVVFIYIFFAPWQMFLFPPLPAILYGVLFLWYSNYMSKRSLDNIGHDAHFWGAVFGFVFIVVVSAALNISLIYRFLDLFYQGLLIETWMM